MNCAQIRVLRETSAWQHEAIKKGNNHLEQLENERFASFMQSLDSVGFEVEISLRKYKSAGCIGAAKRCILP